MGSTQTKQTPIVNQQKKKQQVPQNSLVPAQVIQPEPKIKYQKTKLLGQGTSGKVYQCIDLETNLKYAVKVITLVSKMKSDAILEIENLKRQIALLKKLSHNNIVKYYNFNVSDDLKSVEIVLQKVTPGNLKDLVKIKPFEEKEASKLFKQILTGLRYLHRQGIIHRDLKGANILINEQGIPKISDFGTAKTIKSKVQDNIAMKSSSLKGTPYWMAPQVLKRSGHTFSADIWSLGCTLIQILTGKPPWSGLSDKFQQIIKYIASGMQPPFPPKISKNCEKFLNSCLDTNPKKRLKAQQLLNHAFIRQYNQQDSIQEVDIEQLQNIQMQQEFNNRLKTQNLIEAEVSNEYTKQQSKQLFVNYRSSKKPAKINKMIKQKTNNNMIKKQEEKNILLFDQMKRPNSMGVLDIIDSNFSKKQREEYQLKKKNQELLRLQKQKKWEQELKEEAIKMKKFKRK